MAHSNRNRNPPPQLLRPTHRPHIKKKNNNTKNRHTKAINPKLLPKKPCLNVSNDSKKEITNHPY